MTATSRHFKIRNNMIPLNPPWRPPVSSNISISVTAALCIVLPARTNPKALRVYKKTEIELR